MRLELTQVQSALAKLSLHYPEAGLTGEVIMELANDYLDDLRDERVSAREFDQAVRTARKRCNFFPKIADILAACKDDRMRPRQNVAALIEEKSTVDTPEMLAAGKKNCQIISLMLKKKLTQEEALKKMTFFDK